ncbi:hypothetical protein ASG57_34475 [Bradyrhizobium sp. Leaf396]|nr:hypothetical protein ASG57_34475 [Bradyrhizobium sp. Leaf396]
MYIAHHCKLAYWKAKLHVSVALRLAIKRNLCRPPAVQNPGSRGRLAESFQSQRRECRHSNQILAIKSVAPFWKDAHDKPRQEVVDLIQLTVAVEFGWLQRVWDREWYDNAWDTLSAAFIDDCCRECFDIILHQKDHIWADLAEKFS